VSQGGVRISPRISASAGGKNSNGDCVDGCDQVALPMEPMEEHLRLADVPLADQPGMTTILKVTEK
jgi:hypothetical protein